MRTSALSATCTEKSFGTTWICWGVAAADWMDVCDGCWRRCFRCRCLASLLSALLYGSNDGGGSKRPNGLADSDQSVLLNGSYLDLPISSG